MNRRFHVALVALALVLSLAAGAFVFAQGGPPPQRRGGQMMMGRGPGGPGGPGGPMMLGRLNLTEAQRTQVQKLMEDNRQAHEPLRQKMAEAQQALRAAIFADNGPDLAAIKAAQDAIRALEPEMAQNRVDMEIAVAKILTPEQRKQLRDMPPPMGGREGMGRGRGMMHHPGF